MKKKNSDYDFVDMSGSLFGDNNPESEKSVDEFDSQFSGNGTVKKIKSYALKELLIDNEELLLVQGVFYYFDGVKYVAADQDKIIALMQANLPSEQLALLRHNDYVDAERLLRCDERIKLDDFPIAKHCILFNNGLYDLKKDRFIKPSPKKFVRFQVHATYLPDKKIKTPVFDEFLAAISGGDSQIRKLILAFLGYCLLPEDDGKCFFVLGTAKNSGKSLLARFLEYLFGASNVSHVALHDMGGTFDLSSLFNKAINTAMDLDADIINKRAVSRIKNLTGGDTIEVNAKYQAITSFRSYLKFIFATNHPLLLDKADSAFWDRIIFIPFLNSIPKECQDIKLLDKLIKERDGIVRKAVKAAKILIKNNYEFPKCDIADRIIKTWRYGKDFSIAEFVENCCIISHDSGVKTHTHKLYARYRDYCEEEALDFVSENQFSRILSDIFELPQSRWVESDSRSLRGFIGITLIR